VSNNCGVDGAGLGLLLERGRISRVIASYVGENKEFARQYLAGELTVELTPQGTLAERLRAGGAGIPAFFTATGVGTKMAMGKETREIRGRTYVLEQALPGDVALVEAWEADRWGNLTYRRAGRNFNPVMAMAGRLTIVQSQHIKELGEIDPDHVHTPGIFTDRVLHVPYGDPSGF
jgi:3-oxoadipate CoA-transferase, alpha subunit